MRLRSFPGYSPNYVPHKPLCRIRNWGFRIRGFRMERKKFDPKLLLKDKKFWFASFLIVWAAALQGHMMWLQRQESFQQKFGTIDQDQDIEELAEGSQ